MEGSALRLVDLLQVRVLRLLPHHSFTDLTGFYTELRTTRTLIIFRIKWFAIHPIV
jgi:hypothetical protein